MRAYVLIQTDGHGEPLAWRLQSIPGVLSAEDLRGAYDAIALARADSMRHLIDDIITKIQSLRGVTRALPAPLLRSVTERPDEESSGGRTGSGDWAA